MNELTNVAYQRRIEDVTQDIRRKTGEFLVTAIEIGRLLFEAKAMVEPGGWSRYIEEELPFSHSWANNYMKLYTEFGSDQTSLFGNSQTFLKLRPTQALEVLRLPEEEREEFVESHNVADMSTRQIKQAIQDQLDEAERRNRELSEKLEEAEAENRDTRQELLDAQQRLAAASSSNTEWEKQLEKLKENQKKAERSESIALNQVAGLKKQLQEAEDREKAALADLEKARANPEIPEAMMQQMRTELEAATAKDATAKIQKQLDAANAALKTAEEKAQEAEEKLATAQKKQKMSNQDLMAVQTLGKQMLAIANTINGHRIKAVMQDESMGRPINGFLEQLIEELRTAFGVKKND